MAGSTGERVVSSAVHALVFTDIEGSTALLHRVGEQRWRELLEVHDRIWRAAIERHDGVVESTAGDAFFARFKAVSDAVLATTEAQVAIAAHPWPEDGVVKVRVGIHVGEVFDDGEVLTGMAIHEAARLGSVAHGGQTLISAPGAALTRQQLPPNVHFADLGSHALKDIEQAMGIWQICIDGLPTEFAPLRSSANRWTPQLPAQVGNVIGREQEIGVLADLLLGSEVLITLTGPGGVGKTRLAIEVAGRLAANGVAVGFADLSAVRTADEVLGAVARALGVDLSSLAPIDALATALEEDSVVVLDNLEQIPDVAGPIGEFLGRCRARVLATSRGPVGLRVERVFPVEPLAVTAEGTGMSPAVTMLMAAAERAGATVHVDIDALEELASRLDGLPLALELAGSRLARTSARALADSITDSIGAIGRPGSGDVDRQSTLVGAIGWSYELLTERDRQALRRLSVIGVSAPDWIAAAIVGGDDATDALERLADQSLIRLEPSPGGGTRVRLLETIRGFARARASDDDLADAKRAQDQAWAAAGPGLRSELAGPMQALVLERLAPDTDSLLEVLERLVTDDASVAAALAVQLGRLWQVRGDRRRSIAVLRRIEDASGDAHTADVARLSWLQHTLARTKAWGGLDAGAAELVVRAFRVASEAGDVELAADAANALVLISKETATAVGWPEDPGERSTLAAEWAERTGDNARIASVQTLSFRTGLLGGAGAHERIASARDRGDLAAVVEELLELESRRINRPSGIGGTRAAGVEALALARRLGSPELELRALHVLNRAHSPYAGADELRTRWHRRSALQERQAVSADRRIELDESHLLTRLMEVGLIDEVRGAWRQSRSVNANSSRLARLTPLVAAYSGRISAIIELFGVVVWSLCVLWGTTSAMRPLLFGVAGMCWGFAELWPPARDRAGLGPSTWLIPILSLAGMSELTWIAAGAVLGIQGLLRARLAGPSGWLLVGVVGAGGIAGLAGAGGPVLAVVVLAAVVATRFARAGVVLEDLITVGNGLARLGGMVAVVEGLAARRWGSGVPAAWEGLGLPVAMTGIVLAGVGTFRPAPLRAVATLLVAVGVAVAWTVGESWAYLLVPAGIVCVNIAAAVSRNGLAAGLERTRQAALRRLPPDPAAEWLVEAGLV